MTQLQELKEKVLARSQQITSHDIHIMNDVKAQLLQYIQPAGSLAALENLVKQYAGACHSIHLTSPKKAMLVMVGDHGVVAENINAYPQSLTVAMVQQFVRGKSAICSLARSADAELYVVDVGINAEMNPSLPILHEKVAFGTANMAQESAMTEEELFQALSVGMKVADQCLDNGVTVIGLGEMGIGNTTPSSAITAALLGCPVSTVAGYGSGLSEEGVKHKISVIEKALVVNQVDSSKPLEVLRKVGGLEIAALTGAMIAAASRGALVALDGFVTSAAALVAYRLNSTISQYFIPSHLALEPGHQANLKAMNLKPYLKLKINLGEGAGAPLGMMLLDTGIQVFNGLSD